MLTQPVFVTNRHPNLRACLPLGLQRQMHVVWFVQQMLFEQGLKRRQKAIFLLMKTAWQSDTVPRQSRGGYHRPNFFVARTHRLRRQEGGADIGAQGGAQWQGKNLGTHGLLDCRSHAWFAGGSIPAIF